MVMDLMRSGYECFMQTWRNDAELVRVRWFRVSDDTPFFPKPHLFGSNKTWNRGEQNPPEAPGEAGYVGYHNGANPIGYNGERHCGTDEVMANGGVRGIDPEIITEADGYAACCGVRPRVSVCGLSIPETLYALFNGGSDCSCATGTVVPLVHHAVTGTFAGFTADHWWWPVGIPLFYDPAPLDVFPDHITNYPTDFCETPHSIGPLYFMMWFAVSSGSCVKDLGFMSYWRTFLGRSAEGPAQSGNVVNVSPGPPFMAWTANYSGTTPVGSCVFSEENPGGTFVHEQLP